MGKTRGKMSFYIQSTSLEKTLSRQTQYSNIPTFQNVRCGKANYLSKYYIF